LALTPMSAQPSNAVGRPELCAKSVCTNIEQRSRQSIEPIVSRDVAPPQ